MAYDETLALRIRLALSEQENVVEKKMFGGVGFLIQGNMVCGVHKDMLMVRVGLDAYDETLERPNVLPFDITGRPMRGWVLVTEQGWKGEADLEVWVNQGVTFASTLPPK